MRRRPWSDDVAHATRAFAPFVRPHWRKGVPALLALLGATLVGLAAPWPLAFLLDEVLGVGAEGGPHPDATALIVAVAVVIVLLAALKGALTYVKDVLTEDVAQRVAFDVRRELFERLQHLPLAFHDTRRTGDLLARVTEDVRRVQQLVTESLLVTGLSNLLQVVAMVVLVLVVDWRLGLLVMATLPLIWLTVVRYRGRIKAQEHGVRELEGDIGSFAQETLSSIRLVKAFGRERFHTDRFLDQAGQMAEASVGTMRLTARYGWTLEVAAAISLAALAGFGAHLVVEGALTVGVFVVFLQYTRDIRGPLVSLSRLAGRVAKVLVRAERIIEVLEQPPEITDRPDARPAPKLRGAVALRGVSFRYGDGPPVLDGVDLEIAPGECVAIMGPTGSGKSTLASLVLRLHDPTSGRVEVDGHDLRDLVRASYLEQVAVVLQESLLFQTTLRENIAYGRPDATPEEIERAARVAHCDEFLGRLPAGLDTVVGERGGTLSGGQRQRVAVARALVRDAPVLVLDEPTTGLDAVARRKVMEALTKLIAGRTTLLITHDLETARPADRLLVVRDGRLVEQPPPRALLRVA